MLTDHELELIEDMKQGVCPMCGGNVYLGHCASCGEPVDAVTEEEYEAE